MQSVLIPTVCDAGCQVWDYVVSITVLHLGLSCLVSLSFPTQWVWWVTIGAATLVLCIAGELATSCRKMESGIL